MSALITEFFDEQLPKLLQEFEDNIFDVLTPEVFRLDVAGVGSWVVPFREKPVSIIHIKEDAPFNEVTCSAQVTPDAFESVFLKAMNGEKVSTFTILGLYGRGKIRTDDKSKIMRLVNALRQQV